MGKGTIKARKINWLRLFLVKSFRALRRPEYLGAIGEEYKPLYFRFRIMGPPSCAVRRAYRTYGPAPKHIQISSRGYPDRPWSSGKQLPLGLNLEIWATSLTGYKL